MHCRLVIVLALFACASLLFAQQPPKVLAPHDRPPKTALFSADKKKPPVLRSMTGGFWMIDANFKSSIQVSSILKTAPILVTPILYLSNGKALTLPAVNLEPSGTAVININDALSEKDIAPWATLYGYVELQYQWGWDVLCATVHSLDSVHSLVFSSGLRPLSPHVAEPDAASGTQHKSEGMWWKQERDVTGFVALSNLTAQPVHAKVGLSDASEKNIADYSVTVSPHGTKIIDLEELQTTASSEGGVQVVYDGPDSALAVSGELNDPLQGYSATIPFVQMPARSVTQHVTIAELGLMVGNADPMLQFPAGTVFAPYSLARNIADVPITASLSMYWMEGAKARSLQLGQIVLPPHRTQNLDPSSLLYNAGLKDYHGSISLIFDVERDSGAVLLASGSVDRKNTYVFEVLPRSAIESIGKSVGYWSIANGDDTMVTLWNQADEGQDFIFTLFFPGGNYKYPVHLEPRATHIFNVSDVVHAQVPDADGNIIPATVHGGRAEITGPGSVAQHILVAMDANTYNVRKATCVWTCEPCNNWLDVEVDPAPFGVAVSGKIQMSASLKFADGEQINEPDSWKSSNTEIGTVNDSGLTSGVSAGSLDIEANFGSFPPDDQTCGDPPPACLELPVIGSGGGTVLLVTISIQSSGTIPSADSACGAYYDVLGSYNLGNQVDSGGFCTIGYQATGALSPSSYTGTVTLVRTKTGDDYDGTSGQTLLDSYPSGTNDNSEAAFEVTTPINGVVYDLDAPGVEPTQNQIWRKRMNFFENAQLPDGTYVATEVPFYVRLSCVWGSSGNTFGTGITGDNVLGMGTTKTSWNLQ